MVERVNLSKETDHSFKVVGCSVSHMTRYTYYTSALTQSTFTYVYTVWNTVYIHIDIIHTYTA